MRGLWLYATWAIALLLVGCGPGQRVVIYCAQDQDFAVPVLEDFTARVGLPVTPKYDTEATKSVSLYAEIVQDRKRPRCDVFWNNEILSTIRLQRQGLLQPYASPSATAFPIGFRASDSTWTAFAARARVLLVNTSLVPADQMPRGLLELTEPPWRGKVVMAKPAFGTSATQAACLFAVLGKNKAEAYYRRLRDNDARIAPGNKQAAEWVGQGRTPTGQQVAVCVTDTDDAIAEVKAGRDVAIVFPDQQDDGIGTLFIPNTVMIVKGCPNLQGARRLVDYLLSEEVEAKLASSDSHQLPLNKAVKGVLPPALEPARKARAMKVDWREAADNWESAQTFLRDEFARP